MAKRRRKPKSGAQAASSWLAAMQGGTAQQNYVQGTANKGQAMVSGAVEAVNSGKTGAGFAAAVANGSIVEGLQNPMTANLYNSNTGQKGAAALGTGAQKKKDKYTAAIDKLQPVYAQMQAAADAVDPTRSRGTAMARAQAALAVLMASGKKGGGA